MLQVCVELFIAVTIYLLHVYLTKFMDISHIKDFLFFAFTAYFVSALFMLMLTIKLLFSKQMFNF